jgi:hypothetical protein
MTGRAAAVPFKLILLIIAVQVALRDWFLLTAVIFHRLPPDPKSG